MPKTLCDNLGRVCTKCKEYKTRDKFSRHPGGLHGHRADCLPCTLEQRRENQKARVKRVFAVKEKKELNKYEQGEQGLSLYRTGAWSA